MQDSAEQGERNVPVSQRGLPADLGLGHRIHARHLNFPAASSMGGGIASRLAWFDAEQRLPLAAGVLQRWSTREGGGRDLPSLRWLSSVRVAPKSSARTLASRSVANVSADGADVISPATDEIHSVAPAGGAISETGTVSTSHTGSEGSLPVVSASHASAAQTAAPILRLAERATVNENPAGPDGVKSPSQMPVVKPSAMSAKRMADATSVFPSATAGATSGGSRQTSAGSAMFRSAEKKAGSAGRVRSTIVESVERQVFRAGGGEERQGAAEMVSAADSTPAGSEIVVPTKRISRAANETAELARDATVGEAVARHGEAVVGGGGGSLAAVRGAGAGAGGGIADTGSVDSGRVDDYGPADFPAGVGRKCENHAAAN